MQIAALTPEIATAMLMGLKLMTRDRRILDYAAQGHLSVMAC